jgi:hypothetical protein
VARFALGFAVGRVESEFWELEPTSFVVDLEPRRTFAFDTVAIPV